jgi:hypothetical protein
MRRQRLAALLIGVLVAVTAGCGSSTARSTTGSATTAPAKNFVVATPVGQVSVSLDGHLPPKWPTSFPVPKGAEPAGSGSLGGTASTYSIAVYSTPTSPADSVAFYTGDPALTTSGATIIGAGSSYVGTVRITAPYNAQVTALTTGSTSYLVIALEGSGATSAPSSTTGSSPTSGSSSSGSSTSSSTSSPVTS